MATRPFKITAVAHIPLLLDVAALRVRKPELRCPSPVKLTPHWDHKGAVLWCRAAWGRTFSSKQAGSSHFLMLSFKGSFKQLFLKFKRPILCDPEVNINHFSREGVENS